MILAAKWAREKKVPYLGICLGFQMMVVEWARHIVGVPGKLSLFTSFYRLVSHLSFISLRASITVSSANVHAVKILMRSQHQIMHHLSFR